MREWSEVFQGVDASAAAAAPASAPSEPEAESERSGRWFRRLRDNLSSSRKALTQQIVATATFDPDDDAMWEQIEEGLVLADVGVQSTVAMVQRLEREAAEGNLSNGADLARVLRQIGGELMRSDEVTIDVRAQPAVIMLVGVTGTGKTTTIGKLAARLAQVGKTCVIAAGDTFRAAAGEQLEVWAERAGATLVRGKHGGDPAAVAFDAIKTAQESGADVVIIDTAGRLHTQTPLMNELEKIRRVIEQRLPGAPHETLLTIDATTGQNGMRQAKMFAEAVAVSGVVLTKLDGSAKGGIAVAITHELGIPIKLVGIGESLDDLQPFDSQDFLAALFPDDLLSVPTT
jgi:fused signal recognition particle receptor